MCEQEKTVRLGVRPRIIGATLTGMVGNQAQRGADGARGRTSRQAGRAGQVAGQTATQAVQLADSEWVKTLGKVGVAAIGVVHLLLAWLALQLAFGGGSGTSNDNTGALRQLADNGPGKVLLALMAVGFAAYAVWQAVSAAIGFGHEQDEKKRLFKRVSAGAKAVIGASLTLQSTRLLFGAGQQSSSSKQQDWTGQLLGVPGGKVIVVLIGLVIIGVAGYLVYDGYQAKFLEKISGEVSARLKLLAQSGYIARGVTFGVLGLLVVVAGVQADPDKAGGLDQALKTLRDQPFGPYLLALIALGFVGYGVFNVITAPRREEG